MNRVSEKTERSVETPQPGTNEDAEFQGLLEAEVNRALMQGAIALGVVGIVGFLGIIVTTLIGAEGLEAPLGFSFFGTMFSILLYVMARQGRMKGWVLYVLILSFVSMCNLFFLGTGLFMPAGVATFVTGPLGYLNILLIFLTGFIFNFRLSVAAGLIGGGGFILVTILGADELARSSHPDPTLRQDLVFLPVWIIKGLMMVLAGPMVGAISVIARRLIFKGIREEREKNAVNRIFGQYVSPEVRDRVVKGGESGESGERTEVTVLFSDIRGFTSYSENADPGEIVQRLNEYFDRMVHAIEQEGGTVDKFVGDAIMAVFGGLIPVENPAACAFRAALAMESNLKELNSGWREQGAREFQNGIGLHSGEVIMGALGSQHRKEFTVMGDTVNLASRLESASKKLEHTIILSETLHEQLPVDLRARCQSVGRVQLKGKEAPVQVYGA